MGRSWRLGSSEGEEKKYKSDTSLPHVLLMLRALVWRYFFAVTTPTKRRLLSASSELRSRWRVGELALSGGSMWLRSSRSESALLL